MAISAALTHMTEYRYDKEIQLGPQVIRLRPAPHARTPVTAYTLKVDPQPHFLNWLQDPFGNWMARAVFPEKVREFRVTVDLVARMEVFNPFDFFLEDDAENVPFKYDPELAEELAPFLKVDKAGERLQALIEQCRPKGERTIDFLVAVNQVLEQRVGYTIRMEPGVQEPEETLELETGSCRDSAWLMVQLMRHLGYAARFVSGYLIQLKADQEALDGPSGTDTDFTDLHAWCEVYCPGAGWVGLDPTSGLFAGEGHIPLAATPSPLGAAPISGGLEPCEVEFGHHMGVSRLHETPRVTKPYSEEQWAAVDQLGQLVDAHIEERDMRLTMGGEPTFVALDDPQSDEWNTAAVGPTKQQRASELAVRLQKRFAPRGLITYGQGKWYPGESLPRWAYSIFWRADDEPVWKNVAPLHLHEKGDRLPIQAAERLMRGITRRLKIPEECLVPAYEDPVHFLGEEAALPPGADVSDPKFADPERRARLQRVFSRPLNEARGYVLPIQCWQTKAGRTWISEVWEFRRGHMFLIPGDSPVGLRMPLDSLPGGLAGEGVQQMYVQDPTERRPSLPRRFEKRQPYLSHKEQKPAESPEVEYAPEGRVTPGIRTAMAVEPKDGLLGVFMPPTASAEDYLELLAAVEDTATVLKLPVRIEGYPPPDDPRLRVLKLTPDPGVIEVNVQPASSWPELKAIVTGLYEDARQTRLTTEKFMVDGRHSGTGGGNHIVVGGPTTTDSPFIRRPDMLGSMIRCWQNHPSLSYLFSGMFIGPTSQSPRIDEARDDLLYEMELALSQVPPHGSTTAPWVVDRIFRNLLTDLAGNTHRSEICIDKLYSPDSATGRLGLVELRAFEMPPHAQMSLVQQLLVRALLVWFWDTPYTRPLRNFGPRLHDQMLLPYYLEQNLNELLAALTEAGLKFDPEWFAPQAEFRCPHIGSVTVESQTIELRSALEPWPTMGEEAGGGGTSRYVDSSVERIQVMVRDYEPERYLLVCNGRRVPLQPTDEAGVFVAGVRFRAWQPWSALHPTIGANSPLTFEMIDLWAGRSAGGCTYHVHHPGGRSYETFPVNSNEAESRRLARFFAFGHTSGAQPVPPTERSSRYRATLDLRSPAPQKG